MFFIIEGEKMKNKILRLEAYKILKRKVVLIVMACLFLFIIIQAISLHSSYMSLKKTKIDLYEKHKGVYTDERFNEFWKEAVNVLDEKDLIGYNRFFEGDDKDRLKSKDEIFPNVDFDINFGFFEGWGNFFYVVIGDIKFVPVFIALAFSGIFTYEDNCGMQEILLSTRNGRKKCTKAKMEVAFIMANIAFIMVLFIPLLQMFIMTRGTGGDTSIQMLTWIPFSKVDMSCASLCVHTLYLSFISINVFVLITLIASFLIKNPVVSVCACLGIMYVVRPEALAMYFSNDMVRRIISFNPINALDTVNLVNQSPIQIFGHMVHWIYVVEVVYTFILLVLGVFFIKVLIKHKKYYAV